MANGRGAGGGSAAPRHSGRAQGLGLGCILGDAGTSASSVSRAFCLFLFSFWAGVCSCCACRVLCVIARLARVCLVFRLAGVCSHS
jgi:hypothetical protein